MNNGASSTETPTHRLRWMILFGLFLAMTISLLDRQVLSLVAPVLREQFHLSNTGYGVIVFCFLFGMTVAQIPIGAMIDRKGARFGLSVIVAFWSVANMLHAFASSVLQFSFLRFLLGVGECGVYSSGVKVIGQWFPPRERAFASGLFNSGALIGPVLAPPLVVAITLHFSWQFAFLIPSSVGFLWLVFWWRTYWEPSRHPQLIAEGRAAEFPAEPTKSETAAGPAPSIRLLLGLAPVWGVVLMRAFGGPVSHFYWYWLPEYLKHERGMTLEMVGASAWMPFLAGGIGTIGGGWASGRLIRRGWTVNRARKTVVSAAVALCLCAVLVPMSPSISVAMALICVASLGVNAIAANLMGIVGDVFPQAVLARVSGITGVGDGVTSMVMMLLTGAVIDHYSYLPVFVAAGLFPLATLTALFLLIPRIRPLSLDEMFPDARR